MTKNQKVLRYLEALYTLLCLAWYLVGAADHHKAYD